MFCNSSTFYSTTCFLTEQCAWVNTCHLNEAAYLWVGACHIYLCLGLITISVLRGHSWRILEIIWNVKG